MLTQSRVQVLTETMFIWKLGSALFTTIVSWLSNKTGVNKERTVYSQKKLYSSLESETIAEEKQWYFSGKQ